MVYPIFFFTSTSISGFINGGEFLTFLIILAYYLFNMLLMGSSLDLNEIHDRTSFPLLMGINLFLLEYFNFPSIFYFSQFNNAS